MRPTKARLAAVFSRLALSFLAIAAIASVSPTAADASSNPRYAAIVIDANTGKTLFSDSADASRYPASLTKMMTLYMTFDALKAGRIQLDSRVPFSKYAAARPPTKLGIGAGRSVTVEQAILSLVTKSANDAATALGELIGGTESNFAKMMTAKARALGMDRTTFRNASGLPDPGQKTTARDMATLGIALREHHAKYYGYFSTRSFKFGKSTIGNHNRLLGRIKGVDGIKTGYIRASGFNLVTSVADGNKRLVAVVMGGQSGASRDNHMADLVQKYLPKASTRSSGMLVARAGNDSATIAAYASALPRADAPIPADRPGGGAFEAAMVSTTPQVDLLPAPSKAAVKVASLVPTAAAASDAIDPVPTASTAAASIREGWAIQVASLTSEGEANSMLAKIARKADGILSANAAFTETFTKDGIQYFRARFGGYGSKDDAWNACSALKKKSIPCYAIQQ